MTTDRNGDRRGSGRTPAVWRHLPARRLRAELTDLCRGADDLETILHSFQDKELLRIGVRDILGKDSTVETTQALSDLVRAAAAAGNYDQAAGLTDRAEAAARSISDPAVQAQALRDLVRAAAAAGDSGRIRAVSADGYDPAAGLIDRAEDLLEDTTR